MWELEKALLQQAKCSSVAGDVLKFLSSNSPWIYSPTLAQWIALFWRVQQCLSEDFCRRSSVCSLWAGEWTYSSLGFTDILRQRLVTNLNMLTESRMRMYVYLWGVAGIGKTNHHMIKRWKKNGNEYPGGKKIFKGFIYVEYVWSLYTMYNHQPKLWLMMV